MKCPGQDMRYWKSGAIFEAECPNCGQGVEFFKDESTRRCRHCGTKLVNPKMDFGCAAHCKFAEQCLGELPPELMTRRDDLLKDRVAFEMKRRLARDFRRIGHATRVARYAERIVGEEKGDPAIVLVAAYLHDVTDKGTGPGKLDEEGSKLAREILERLDAREELIEEVCDLIAHRQDSQSQETTNFKVFHDSDRLAELEEDQKGSPMARERHEELIEKSFLTKSGREMARRVLLEPGEKAEK